MAETVRGEAVDDSVGVAELIVEAGADHASGKRVAHIGHAFADVVPDIGNFRRRRLALQRDENRGAPRLRIALDVIEARRFLKRPLKALGHLFQRLVQVRARPARKHDHGAEGEGRVFVPAKAEVGHRARHHQRDHAVDREGPVLERPLREIELHQEEAPSSRTLRPGYRACTPAVTTMSPLSSPLEMTTDEGSWRLTSTVLIATVWPTCRPPKPQACYRIS